MKKALMALGALIMLSGCHKTLPELPLTEAVTAIEKQLVTSQSVSVSNVDQWTSEDTAKFVTTIHKLQCAGKAADPIVPVFTAPITISLSGAFHSGMSAELDVQANQAGPKFMVASSTDKSNGLSIPMTFTALDTLPDVIFKQEHDRLEGVLDKPYYLNTSITELDHLSHNREDLAQMITLVIGDYDARRCLDEKTFPQTGMFMGVRGHKQK